MGVKFLVFVLLVGLTTTLAQKKCCFPNQFEADSGTTTASVVAGQGMVVMRNYQFAYDYTNKRAAYINYREDLGQLTKFQNILDFKKGVEYDIQVKQQISVCSRSDLQTNMTHCVPGDATFIGSTYYGDHEFNVDFFDFNSQKGPLRGNTTMGVSKGDCIPFSFVTIGTLQNVPTLHINGWVNYTAGISDPAKYFTVPSFCQQSSSGDLEMDNDPIHAIFP